MTSVQVHYVNDADRGVVWEEVIIMLPPHVGIVMLSATVPNVMDFADWVGRTKRKIVHVTGTTKRPVPLEHALYYGGEMYTVGLRETFLPEGHRQATLAWKGKNEAGPTKAQQVAARPDGRGGGGTGARGGGQGGGQGRGGFGARGGSADAARKQIAGRGRSGGPNTFGGERQQLIDLIGMLGKKQLLPVAFFCFSKKRCDSSVDGLGGLDLTTSAEKHTIHTFVEK
ncbi:hypothetical protein FOA52_003227 [Chlamydomonas sp. UWO 241]|nr:hypothetical protein FOA52_003227 [Chlamydomonas sp. UWO 241]